jgi:hypothetical protein
VTVVVSSGQAANRYLIPGVAHNPGVAGTLWRTDVAAVNLESADAAVTLTFRSRPYAERHFVVPSGGTVEWANVLEGAGAPDADLSARWTSPPTSPSSSLPAPSTRPRTAFSARAPPSPAPTL